MPSYIFVNSYGGHGAGSGNPCPSGWKADTLIVETLLSDNTLKNITFLICNEKTSSDKDLELGLGLGLGLGIPFLVFIIYCIYKYKKSVDYMNNLEIAMDRPVDRGHNQNDIQPEVITPVKEVIFNKLGYRLHRDFLAGNLTSELKVSLTSFTVEDLLILENYALEHNKRNIGLYIRTIIDSKNTNIVVTIP